MNYLTNELVTSKRNVPQISEVPDKVLKEPVAQSCQIPVSNTASNAEIRDENSDGSELGTIYNDFTNDIETQ